MEIGDFCLFWEGHGRKDRRLGRKGKGGVIDVLRGLLDKLKEMHRESEVVICQTVQAGRGRAYLCLK